MNVRPILLAAVLAVAPAAAQAQVGYPPDRSPFRDLEYRQQVNAEVGYLHTQSDGPGVAPRSAPFVGARWAMQFSNPFIISARIAQAFSERDVIDPAATAANRFVRTETVPLTMADVQIGLALTGYRSWHNLVPELNAGMGVIGAFDERDEGGFRVGTPLALTGGAGVRWVPGGQWHVRADLTHRMYRISYPQSYFQSTVGEPVLGAQDSNSRWTHNPSLSISIGYLFDR